MHHIGFAVNKGEVAVIGYDTVFTRAFKDKTVQVQGNCGSVGNSQWSAHKFHVLQQLIGCAVTVQSRKLCHIGYVLGATVLCYGNIGRTQFMGVIRRRIQCITAVVVTPFGTFRHPGRLYTVFGICTEIATANGDSSTVSVYIVLNTATCHGESIVIVEYTGSFACGLVVHDDTVVNDECTIVVHSTTVLGFVTYD